MLPNFACGFPFIHDVILCAGFYFYRPNSSGRGRTPENSLITLTWRVIFTTARGLPRQPVDDVTVAGRAYATTLQRDAVIGWKFFAHKWYLAAPDLLQDLYNSFILVLLQLCGPLKCGSSSAGYWECHVRGLSQFIHQGRATVYCVRLMTLMYKIMPTRLTLTISFAVADSVRPDSGDCGHWNIIHTATSQLTFKPPSPQCDLHSRQLTTLKRLHSSRQSNNISNNIEAACHDSRPTHCALV